MGNLGPSQHLRHPGPADAQVSSERGPALEIARVQQRLIISGELERVTALLRFPAQQNRNRVETVSGSFLILTPLRYGFTLRGLIWSVYTLTWTAVLLTPQPVHVAEAVLGKEQLSYASKTTHVSAYAVLTGWLNASLRWPRWLVGCLSAHALGTEFFQRFVLDRCASWAGVGWERIGIVCGLLPSWGW